MLLFIICKYTIFFDMATDGSENCDSILIILPLFSLYSSLVMVSLSYPYGIVMVSLWYPGYDNDTITIP